MEHRKRTQPFGYPTLGCTFRNPEGKRAAWELIEGAGLKGYQKGSAKFSEKHCNFIVNVGQATADDVEALGNLAVKKVKEKFGVELVWELKKV